MKKTLSTLQNRFSGLNAREKALVQYGGALIALVFTWMVLLEPAVLTLLKAEEKQLDLANRVADIQLAASELDQLRAARSRVVVPQEQATSRLTQLLAQEKLSNTTSLSRSESGALELRVNKAPVASLLRWLAQAEGLSTIKITDIQFAKSDAGIVSGSVLLTHVQIK